MVKLLYFPLFLTQNVGKPIEIHDSNKSMKMTYSCNDRPTGVKDMELRWG